ncbi:MAG: PEGA domain-containing protein [Kofleriaceae bacterium]
MRAALMSLAVVALVAGRAHAEEIVGVIVVGDDMLRPRVSAYLEHWLESHGRKVMAQPMSADAVNTLTNCLIVDDPKCARGVVEQRSKSDAIVFARADLGTDHGFVLNAYWFAKGHEAIAERRACEQCNEEGWHGVIDQILDALTSQMIVTGHLHVESEPAGMIVLFDNAQVGLTPLDRDVPVGHHRVDLMHKGHHVGRRNVEIDANDTTDVKIKAQLESEGGHPRLVPGIVLGGGIALLGVGGVLLYYGSLGGGSQKWLYPDSTPIGIGVIAAGVGATIIGSVLFAQAGPKKSLPVAAVTHDGAYVGWMTRF